MQRRPNHPRISVVIPALNRASVISRAIDSVLRQSFSDFEIVVVDDGSTDGTVEVVRRLEGPRVRLILQSHAGPSAARNAGAATAKGRLLTFLDSDDVAEPTWLEEMGCQFDEVSVDVALCGYSYVETDGRLTTNLPPAGRSLRPDDVASRFLAGCWMVDKDLFLSSGGFDAEILFGENTEMALRLFTCRPGLVVKSIACPLVLLTRREDPPDPAAQASGARAVVERYTEHSGAFPETWAAYHTILGAASARRADFRLARRYFLEAFRSDPRGKRRALRLIGSLIPPAAKRAWPPS